MKKILLIAVIVAIATQWSNIQSLFEHGTTKVQYTGSQQVELYATSWCGYCAKARKHFARHGVPYTEYDIETSKDAHQRFKALGGKGVPLIVIDDQTIYGWRKETVSQILGL